MNLANKLTLLRIILIPLFLVFLEVKNIPYGIIIATLIFIAASITDKLDGYIARSRNQVTNFGKLMDPIADKLLITAALIALVEFHIIGTWVAMIVIAREFLVTGLRTIAAAEGSVIAAGHWGKLKTVTQIVAVIAELINYELITINFSNVYYLYFNYFANIVLAIAVFSTVMSGIDYFVKNKKFLAQ